MRPAPRAIHFVFPLCALLLLAGCAGEPIKLASRSAPSMAAGLPELDELRAGSALLDNLQTGADAALFHSHVQFKNNAVVLSPLASDHFQWALWSFDPAGLPLQDVVVNASANQEGSELFLGVADFEKGAWVFGDALSPLPPNEDFTLPLDSATNVSPAGLVFVAVVCVTPNDIAISALNFHTIGEPGLAAHVTADIEQGDVPLNVVLDASASTGNIVSFEWDIAGSGSFLVDTGTEPTLPAAYSAPGVFAATVRVTDDQGATATDSVIITATQNGNLPPVAVLQPDVLEGDGEAGFGVNLSSATSSDPDGSITLYEWDLDGDTGNGFELSSATPDPQSLQIGTPGELRLRLRVTDDDGLQSTDSVLITAHGWVQVPLLTLPAGKTAGGFSLASVGKGPDVSFVNGSTNLLEYVHSTTGHGADPADWKITDITGARVTKNTELVKVGSRAAICFSGLDDALTYTRSNTADGGQQTDWELVTVDAVDALGMSMTVADGKPAISYVERTNLGKVGLKYAFSSTATGIDPADWDSLTIQAADAQIQSFGSFTSLQLVDGRPAIAWQSTIDSLDAKRFVNFAHSASAGGTLVSDWDSTLALQECIDRDLTLALVDGKPAISFGARLPADNTASYLHSSSIDGASTADWSAVKIGATGEGGFHTEMAVLGDRPLLSYSIDIGSDSQLGLRLAESSSVDGALVSDWLSQEAVTGPNQMQDGDTDHDLAVIDGFPALVFFDQQTTTVTYAIRF